MDDESNNASIIFPGLFESTLNYWTSIHSFSEIQIHPSKKTIVFCDIDDTLLHHPIINMHWVKLVQSFFTFHHKNRGNLEFHRNAIEDSNLYFDGILQTIPFMHTDKAGFFELVKAVTKLVFVTARSPQSRQYTYENLASIGVDPDVFEVHFSDTIDKGHYISHVFDIREYDRVIFIDDQQRNLENVFNAVHHAGLEIYQFNRPQSNLRTYYPFPDGFPLDCQFNGVYLEKTNPPEL